MTNPKVDKYGNKYWYNNQGQLHRDNGPAIESKWEKSWMINGNYHRDNGPACELFGGDKYWYNNGKLHREDGPACEYASGGKQWYINGKRIE
jgi:hypothetical protein